MTAVLKAVQCFCTRGIPRVLTDDVLFVLQIQKIFKNSHLQ